MSNRHHVWRPGDMPTQGSKKISYAIRQQVSMNKIDKSHPKTISRERLESDVEAFLAKGGTINEVPFGVLNAKIY